MFQLAIMIGTFLSLFALGFMLYFAIKKHDKKMQTQKKKRGKYRYMPPAKIPAK